MLPKSNVLAAAIVVVLIALLLSLWALVSRPAAGRVDERNKAAKTKQEETTVELGADLEPTIRSGRSDAGAPPEPESVSRVYKKPALRIQVLYASGLDEHPEGLDVEVSNRTGALFQPRRVAPNEFLLVEEPPDVYIVIAKARGFRVAAARAQLSEKHPESRATITLIPQRSVRVRWRSDDGRPILVSAAEQAGLGDHLLLEVYATKFRPADGFRPLERHALALLRLDLMVDEGTDGRHVAREAVVAATDFPPIDPSKLSDAIGTLDIEEDGLVWAGAFCRGEWVASLPIAEGAREVEFVTPLADLEQRGGEVKLVVVDDVTGLPVAGAGLFLDAAHNEGGPRADEKGVLVREHVPSGRYRGRVSAEGFRDTSVDLTVRSGESVDLGTVHLVREHPSALFRVVDERGESGLTTAFELVLLEADADSTRPRPTRTSSCDHRFQVGDRGVEANLRFDDVQSGRYLLRCKGQLLDAAPRVVEPGELRPASHTTPTAVIVVRPAGRASFVLDPPIAKGTQVIVETPTGLPLRELDVDEYGVASTDLLEGDYRLHLVEYGRATGSVHVRVDRNPFVFEIHR